MSPKMKNSLKNILLLTISISIAFVIAEIIVRYQSHYVMTKLALWRPPSSNEKLMDPPLLKNDEINPMLAAIPLASGLKKQWFFDNLPTPSNRAPYPTPDLAWRAAAAPTISFEVGEVYNLNYILNEICKDKHAPPLHRDILRHLKSIYVFKDKYDNLQPRYRLLKGAIFPGSHLVTNRFGFRGREIPFEKPAHTIRIAFLGASTTIASYGFIHAYPEYVEYWLNQWAKSQHLQVKFDVINAGFSGYKTVDIAAIFKESVLPLQPDIAIYYEGANDFYPNDFIIFKDRIKFKRPIMDLTQLPIANYSIFISRLLNLYDQAFFSNVKEPAKPAYTVKWPITLDEHHPNLTSPDMPSNLKVILTSLNSILHNAQQQNIIFIPTSFVWNLHQGMIMHLPKNRDAFNNINKSYWPFTYEWIRRNIDFQNSVYREYAKNHHLYFIDIDKYYPQNSDLFMDNIHGSPTGVRMLAWVEVQQLIPIIKAQIDAGKLPRAWRKEKMPANYDNNKENFIITKSEIENLCKHLPTH